MKKGVDVSVFQGVINWTKIKNAGYDFTFIKATQGHGTSAATKDMFCFTDSKFKTNIEGASAAKMDIGVYHYFTAQTEDEADKEAAHFISAISPYRSKINLWAVVDVEDEEYCSKLDKLTLTKLTRRFMLRLTEAGFKAMLYTNPNYLQYKFTSGAFAQNDIWLAHWGVSKPYAVNNMMVWQYGLSRVDGCTTDIDVNYGYYDEAVVLSETKTIGKASAVKIKEGAYYKAAGTSYTEGKAIPASVRAKSYSVDNMLTFGGVECALLSGINSWVAVKYLTTV